MAPATIYLDPADNYYSIRDRIAVSRAPGILLVLPDMEDPPLDSTDLALLRRLAERDHIRLALVTPDKALRRAAQDYGLPTFRSRVLGRRFVSSGQGTSGNYPRPRVRLGFAPADDRLPPDQQPSGWGRLSKEQRIARLAQAVFAALVGLTLAVVVMANRPAAATAPTASTPVPLSAAALLQIQLDDTLPATAAAADGPTITIPGRLLRLEQRWEAAGTATAGEAMLRQQALLGLSAAAPGLLQARVGPDELLLPGSAVISGGESALQASADGEMMLRLSAILTGTVVSRADVTSAALEALDAVAPAGTVIDSASVHTMPGTYDPLTASVIIGALGLATDNE